MSEESEEVVVDDEEVVEEEPDVKVFSKLSGPHQQKVVEMSLTEYDLAMMLQQQIDDQYTEFDRQRKQEQANRELQEQQ